MFWQFSIISYSVHPPTLFSLPWGFYTSSRTFSWLESRHGLRQWYTTWSAPRLLLPSLCLYQCIQIRKGRHRWRRPRYRWWWSRLLDPWSGCLIRICSIGSIVCPFGFEKASTWAASARFFLLKYWSKSRWWHNRPATEWMIQCAPWAPRWT